MHFSTYELQGPLQKVCLCGPVCKEALEQARTNVPSYNWEVSGQLPVPLV